MENKTIYEAFTDRVKDYARSWMHLDSLIEESAVLTEDHFIKAYGKEGADLWDYYESLGYTSRPKIIQFILQIDEEEEWPQGYYMKLLELMPWRKKEVSEGLEKRYIPSPKNALRGFAVCYQVEQLRNERIKRSQMQLHHQMFISDKQEINRKVTV